MPGNLSNSEKVLYNEGKWIQCEPVLTLELDVIILFPATASKKALEFSTLWQAVNYSEVLIKKLGVYKISIGIFLIVKAKQNQQAFKKVWRKISKKYTEICENKLFLLCIN